MLEQKDLEKIQTMIDTSLSREIAASEERMWDKFDARMDEKIAASEERMQAYFDARMDEKIAASEERMQAYFDARMDEKIAASENRMQAYFEAAIMPKFDLLLDAFQSITETYAPLKRVEKLEEDVVYLKSDVRELGREVSSLKKAQ